MIRWLVAIFLLVPALAQAQQVILTTREQQALKALMGTSGEIEQLILRETASQPLSTSGHARIAVDSVSHVLRCSINGGAYADCLTSGSIPWINVTSHGASPSASAAANTAAFQAAHDAVPASGGVVYIPAGTSCYSINAEITVTKPVTWLGEGSGRVDAIGTSGSCVRLTTATQNGFAVNTNEPVNFVGFAIVSTVATSGAAIRLNAGVVSGLSGNQRAEIESMQFNGVAVGVKSVNAIFTRIDKSTFWQCKTTCIDWENQGNPDQNGPSITNSTFYDDTFSHDAIIWRSGGGLRVVNNVILGFAGGVSILPTFSGVTTQEFWITDNAITSFSSAGISVLRSSGTASILYLHIKNNTIATLNSPGAGIGINFATQNATWVSEIYIMGNHIADLDRGIVIGGGTRYRIADNEFLRITTGAATGIDIAGVAAQVQIGPNRFTSVTNPIVDAIGAVEAYAFGSRHWLIQATGGVSYPITWPTALPGGTQCLQLSAAGAITTTGSACSAGPGITSLNGLTGASQTFANDTNVTISSAGTTHTLGWSGTLAASRGGFGADMSAASGVISFNAGARVVNNVLTAGQLLYGAAGNTVASSAELVWDATTLNISNNASALPAAPANSPLRAASASASPTNIAADAFGGQGAFLCRRADGTPAALTALAANDAICALAGQGYETNTPGYTATVVSIGFFAADAFTNASQPTYQTFGTTPSGSTTLAERMRITAAGDVGIGVTAPGQKLSVSSTIGAGVASTTTGQLVLYNATNANTFTIQPGATGSNLTFTLPTADGAVGTCLSTNGSGTLSWANCSSGGTGLTSLNGMTGATQSFARVNDTNVTLAIASVADVHTWTAGWTGTLAASRGGFGADMSSASGAISFNSGARVVSNVLSTPGNVLFAAATNAVGSNNKLTWDDTNIHLAITNNASALPAVISTTAVRQRWASASTVATLLTAEAWANQASLLFLRGNGTPAAPTTLVADNPIGAVAAGGYDSAAYQADAVSVGFFSGGTWTGSSRPTFMTFGTTPSGSTTLTERMRVTAAGFVGIGATAPSAKLEISGGNKIAADVANSFLYVSNPTAPNSYSGANYDRVGIGYSGNIAYVLTDAAGTGTLRSLRLTSGSGLGVTIQNDGAVTVGAPSGSSPVNAVNSQSGYYVNGVKVPAQADNIDWTGVHTFTNQASIQLKPFGASSGNTSEVRWLELAANGVNYVGFKAPDSIALNVMWKLPVTDGSVNQCLKTDGAQNLGWVNCSSGLTGSGSNQRVTTWSGASSLTSSAAWTFDSALPRQTMTAANTAPSFNTSRVLNLALTTSGSRTASGALVEGNPVHGIYVKNTDASTPSGAGCGGGAVLGLCTSVTNLTHVEETAAFGGTAYGLGSLYYVKGSTYSAERAALFAGAIAETGSNFALYGANDFVAIESGVTSFNLVIGSLTEVWCGKTPDCTTKATGYQVQNRNSGFQGFKMDAGVKVISNLGTAGGFTDGDAWTNAISLETDPGATKLFRVLGSGFTWLTPAALNNPSFANSRPLNIDVSTTGTRVATGSDFVTANSMSGFYVKNTDASQSVSVQLGDRTSVTGFVHATETSAFTGTAYGLVSLYEINGSTSAGERAAAFAGVFVNTGSNAPAYGHNSFLGVKSAVGSIGTSAVVLAELNCQIAGCLTNAFGAAIQNVTSAFGTSQKAAVGLVILPTLTIGGGGADAWNQAIRLGNYDGTDTRFAVSGGGDISGLSITVSSLGGAGNRTACVNNSGTFYTVASGAPC